MRNLTIGVLCLVFCAAASAQERGNALYFFISNPTYTESDASGSHFTGAVGIGYQRSFSDRWAGEFAIARQRQTVNFIETPEVNQPPIVVSRTWDSTPVDGLVQYHFRRADAAWRPYLGGGMRWAAAPEDVAEDTEVFVTVNGGVVWFFGPALGLRLDGKYLPGDRPAYVDPFQGSVGLAWRF